VDQSNYERRKATIYQMTNIYNRAKYILAVPDLHLSHVAKTSESNSTNFEYTSTHDELIFRLLHGNSDQLIQIDEDEIKDSGNNQTTTISKQTDKLQNAILFLVDLIKDWSTRVWVISEYSIARKNSIMKYWFIQLNLKYSYLIRQPQPGSYYLDTFSFFEFNFNQTSSPTLKIDLHSNDTKYTIEWKKHLESKYNYFHYQMFFHLGKKQFLETILQSKASRNGKFIIPKKERKNGNPCFNTLFIN
jgi:hypothetical protein